MQCLFVSDLHGRRSRYAKLFQLVRDERPDAVFVGGDLLPHGMSIDGLFDFMEDFLEPDLKKLSTELGDNGPTWFVILGNDDSASPESDAIEFDRVGLWHYCHMRRISFGECDIYGYSYVPPTPFLLKDWEKYDISRYVDPGCISPEEGFRTVEPDHEPRFATIADDLKRLTEGHDLSNAIMMFHSPPYQTDLDRAALDGKMIDMAPLDVHVGSIAIKRFIEERQPRLTLHGHIHESIHLTGSWCCRIGRTYCFGAAHDGPELSVVRFDPSNLEAATHDLI
ncbi:MAG TPA: metallophosphoesterase [candidate division Zixibacteria bacterium]|nr:metallophosphoesterase [candidate division Zixibacteria bacterium]